MPDVSRAHAENKIPLARIVHNEAARLVKAGDTDRAGNEIGQIVTGDARGVDLAAGVNVGDNLTTKKKKKL